jgi:hypothetical protein
VNLFNGYYNLINAIKNNSIQMYAANALHPDAALPLRKIYGRQAARAGAEGVLR